MKTIDELVSDFLALPPGTIDQWHTREVVSERLHLSRSSDGTFAIFLEGPAKSFGEFPAIPGVSHSENVSVLTSGRRFAALRLTTRDSDNGNRAMAHIAYELARRLEEAPTEGNASLVRSVAWVLQLLGHQEGILSSERQRGLIGECLLLRQLLMRGRALSVDPSTVLQRWWGSYPSRRDFASKGIAVEVKTTSLASRSHRVGSIDQLDAQTPSERVYVYSVGLRTDMSGPKKLPDFVLDVESQLVGPSGEPVTAAYDLFRTQLRQYGYDRDQESYYRAAPGFLRPHLVPALFDAAALRRLRLSDFVGGCFPEDVSEVSYTLEIQGEALGADAVEEVLTTLITSDALSSS